ncbi:MAG: hypothetical protein KJ607_14185 [Bacteroidetes bacterium]|nr:hypothetical protein [Bacteroidota bacterium]
MMQRIVTFCSLRYILHDVSTCRQAGISTVENMTLHCPADERRSGDLNSSAGQLSVINVYIKIT